MLVVVDEAYFEFVTDRRTTRTAMEAFDGERPLVVARTFSKIYSLAGAARRLRARARSRSREAVDKVREPFNVNSVAQAAAYYSLDDEAEVRRRRAENQEQKTYLYSGFDRLRHQLSPVARRTSSGSDGEAGRSVRGAPRGGRDRARASAPPTALRVDHPLAEDAPAVIAAFEAAVDASRLLLRPPAAAGRSASAAGDRRHAKK